MACAAPRFAAFRRERGLEDEYQLTRAEWDEVATAAAADLYGAAYSASARRTIARFERYYEQKMGETVCRPSEAA